MVKKKLGAMLGTAALVAGFSACGTAPEGAGDDGLPGEDPSVGLVSAAATACQPFTSTVAAHVTAGRATQAPFFFWTAYYANGPAREALGLDPNQTVTLYPSAGGGYTSNSANCPPAPPPPPPATGCGDGIVQVPGELCDGTDFGGLTCLSFGSNNINGRLRCTSTCTVDSSGCDPACGNSVAEGTEQCDGADLRGQTCASIGLILSPVLPPGTLACSDTCTSFEVSGCNTKCGDGVIQSDEQCEGTNFAGKRCQDYVFLNSFPFNIPTRYAGGQLECQGCSIGFNSCTPTPGCYYQPQRGGRLEVRCF
jgi:hypothetical protein